MPKVCTVLLLGACSASINGIGGIGTSAEGRVPEAVVALAAPHQDVQSARLREEDGCYWYRHTGPVETTLVPLRSVDGRPICTGAGPAAAR
nr:hypothetical protein [Roseitranquillus sediminis]